MNQERNRQLLSEQEIEELSKDYTIPDAVTKELGELIERIYQIAETHNIPLIVNATTAKVTTSDDSIQVRTIHASVLVGARAPKSLHLANIILENHISSPTELMVQLLKLGKETEEEGTGA